MKTKILPVGTMVHIQGVPVILAEDAKFESANWDMIEQFQNDEAQTSSPHSKQIASGQAREK